MRFATSRPCGDAVSGRTPLPLGGITIPAGGFRCAVRFGTGSPRPPNAAAESRGATAREFGRRVTLEPLSIVVATRSHLFADISCAGLLCGKANHATLPRRNRARRVSFRPVDVGRGIAASVRTSRNYRPRDRAWGAAARRALNASSPSLNRSRTALNRRL